MLSIVSTPIGNLGDITLRAIEVLKQCDLVAAEDTRHTGHLLRHFEISKPLVSYHKHNEAQRTTELLTRLRAGAHIALVTDAGTPGVSDPGRRLLRACIGNGLAYTIIPGPSAVLTALIGSGFPTDEFYFGGFLPTKSGQRERMVRAAGERAETSIFFESPHRLLKTLVLFAQLFPQRRLCVGRELTKHFEEFRIGTGPELAAHYTAHPPRGEITLVIAGLAKAERKAVRSASPERENRPKDT